MFDKNCLINFLLSEIRRGFALSFILIFLSARPTFSQELKFDHLSVKQGLSQGNTLDIIQDKFSFIWIATEDGLNLFDGYHFTIYRNDPSDSTSISNNNVYSISEDKDGNLWVGTQTGLNFYDRSQNKFIGFFNDPKDGNSIS